jgi:hypothetical protein
VHPQNVQVYRADISDAENSYFAYASRNSVTVSVLNCPLQAFTKQLYTYPERLIMALRAVFDESGIDPKGPAFVMGGFLSTVEEWQRAADAWIACLHQRPSIKTFHHYESQNRCGEFRGWKEEDADAKVLSLAQTIARFGLQGFVTIISHSWFVPRDKRASKGMFGSRIYDHAFMKVVSCVTDYVNRAIPGDDKVDFIFDRRPELKQCIPVFEEYRESLWRGSGTCVPDDDETNVALQMADLLASEFFKIVETQNQSEAVALINTAQPIFHLRCTPPKWFSYALALHGFCQSVKDDADSLQKRIYGHHEKSIQVIVDAQELLSNKLEFDNHFKNLCEQTGAMDQFSEYMKESDEVWVKLRKEELRRGSGKL